MMKTAANAKRDVATARISQVYHPNIDLEGNICLNILREDWKPVLSINSVIYGLNFLFIVRLCEAGPACSCLFVLPLWLCTARIIVGYASHMLYSQYDGDIVRRELYWSCGHGLRPSRDKLQKPPRVVRPTRPVDPEAQTRADSPHVVCRIPTRTTR